MKTAFNSYRPFYRKIGHAALKFRRILFSSVLMFNTCIRIFCCSCCVVNWKSYKWLKCIITKWDLTRFMLIMVSFVTHQNQSKMSFPTCENAIITCKIGLNVWNNFFNSFHQPILINFISVTQKLCQDKNCMQIYWYFKRWKFVFNFN